MSTMVLAELIAWVAIAVADLGFDGAQQGMETNWLQPMDQTQQEWIQPSLDHTLQMMNGGKPQNVEDGSLQSSLDQMMNLMKGGNSPMGPNWPQPSLEHTVQGEKPQEVGAGLQSTMDQMLDLMNVGKPNEVGSDWLEILCNLTTYILYGMNGLKQQEGSPVQFPLNQTTALVTSLHHPELPPSLNMSDTKLPIEILTEISNATDDGASNVEMILSEHGVEVNKDVLDIINNAVTNNFRRDTLRKILTALYDEIDPVYRDVYKKKVVPKLTGLSEGKQMLLDELSKTYNLTQTDKDNLSYTFVTRALGDLSKEIASGTTKYSEIRKRSKAIEQLMAKQSKA